MMKGAANRFRSGGTNCKIDRGATTSCLSTQFRARVVRVISGNDYSYRRAIKGVAAHGPTRGDVIRRHSHNNQQHGDLSQVRRSWGTDAEELVGNETRQSQRAADADRDADQRHS
jgi:hypothetical protein